ncbi:MAG TPA: hypothetical protein VKE51_15335 [Vicinamibacterales bacterium]|nr:hypothetical protein [Vicinamibacterales bacterium]
MLLEISLRLFQSLLDQIDVRLGRPDAGRRLFLERVKHVHRLLESNRVHRSMGVSVVRLDDLQHTGPRPFHGFAVGAVPPNCAMPRAFPMSSFTVAGKLKKSRLADPTQCNGFSWEAETRRTSRLSLFWDIQASGAVFMDILEFRARVLVISGGTGKTGEQPRGVRGHACHFLN